MKNKDDNSSLNSLSLDAITAIRDRRSVRAFLDKPVSKDTVYQILEIARWAPSGVNTQPWKVAVLGKKAQQTISSAIIHARNNSIPENPDYQYYPEQWVEPYKSRRKACGLALYGALNIKMEDSEKRKAQWYRNYAFFEAPVAFIFHIDKVLCKGSWVDFGMFIQNVMLAARGFGLETCPQASLAEYPDIVRNVLSLSDDDQILCGMALGHADWSHPINQYRTERETVEKFAQWYE